MNNSTHNRYATIKLVLEEGPVRDMALEMLQDLAIGDRDETVGMRKMIGATMIKIRETTSGETISVTDEQVKEAASDLRRALIEHPDAALTAPWYGRDLVGTFAVEGRGTEMLAAVCAVAVLGRLELHV